MSKIQNIRAVLCAGAAVVGLSMAGHALAQTTEPAAVDEITVTSKYGTNQDVRMQRVGYSDLDLTTKAGQDELTSRIGKTASDLCHKLGDSIGDQPLTAMPSCQSAAIASADDQMKMAIAMAQPHGSGAAMAMNDTSSAPMAEAAPAAPAYAAPASYTTSTVTNGPVPDTAENRAKYGSPMSHAGKRTAPAGN
jgi:UrcA family protein